MVDQVSIGAIPPTAAAPEAKPKNLKDAAAQFEAMLLQQMLRSTRESLEGDGDSSSGTMRDFAEQNLAQLLAQSGGLGIGAMVARGLADHRPVKSTEIVQKSEIGNR